MKLAILHTDQCVELLLKERVRHGGKSIYKNPKETISIWQAYDILESDLGCMIPEKADLQLLHEERNSIQHKYANPSAEDANFLIGKAIQFVQRFMREELADDVANHVPSKYLQEILP